MKKYDNNSGRGGITGYDDLPDGIILEFNYKDRYLYDNSKPGEDHVKNLKILAKQGEGLTTYINQNIRDNYRKKLSYMDRIITDKILKGLIDILCEVIRQRKEISFYYKSDDGNDGIRTIRPYMLAIRENNTFYIAGLPVERLNQKIENRQPGQYTITKFNLEQFKISENIFDDPGVLRKYVTETPTVKVVCRFIYDNENQQEIMSEWIKVFYERQ